MKKFLLFGILSLLVVAVSCNKVEQPVPTPQQTGDPYDLYPYGDSTHYAQNAWPTFQANTNTERNILVEDFTGHGCGPCALVGDFLHDLVETNNGRMVALAIHASPSGTTNLQAVSGVLTNVFYNEHTETLGQYFGDDWPSSGFASNPNGMISRVDHGFGGPVTPPSSWENAVNTMLSDNLLKVNIQAASNYYPSTKGLFVHTEIEVDPTLSNELRVVAYLVEDSIIGAQYTGGNPIYDLNYVHRDILRDAIDGFTFGQVLDAAHQDANGNYYFNYIYEVPEGYTNTNAHLVIFVRDAVTEEVYQVIKHQF